MEIFVTAATRRKAWNCAQLCASWSVKRRHSPGMLCNATAELEARFAPDWRQKDWIVRVFITRLDVDPAMSRLWQGFPGIFTPPSPMTGAPQ